MKNTKKIIVASATLAVMASIGSADEAKAEKKEKCYGIVKAGKNDCGSADGSHSCAGLAKTDGDYNEWVLLPADTCNRIIGGSTIAGKPPEDSDS